MDSSTTSLEKADSDLFFYVRPDKDDEAKALREEWKNKEVEEHITSRDKSTSLSDIVFVVGQEEGYTVKYTPSPD